MAEDWLNSILNWLIPIIIIGFLGYILYKPFKKPIDELVNKIKSWKQNREEKEVGTTTFKTISYE